MQTKELKCSLLIIIILLLIGFISFFLFNTKSINMNSDITMNEAKSIDEVLQTNKEEIDIYNTPYTVGYKNIDNSKSLYVFSSPIRYFDKEKMNIKLKKIDISTYFDDNEIAMYKGTNSIKFPLPENAVEKEIHSLLQKEFISAICYKDENAEYFLYTTNLGICIEIDLYKYVESIDFPIELTKYSFINDVAGYAIISDASKKIAIAHPGFCYNEHDKKYFLDNRIEIVKKDNESSNTLRLHIDPDVAEFQKTKIAFNIDFYFEKSFSDSPVYENRNNLNSILNQFYLFGNSKLGNSVNLMRFDFVSITPQNADNIQSVKYNFKVIGGDDGNVELTVNKIASEWCAWQSTWDNKPMSDEKIGDVFIGKEGWYSIDITEYVKACVKNGYGDIQRFGLSMSEEINNKVLKIIASADNSSYPPYLEVIFK